ncbi:MAG: protein kinase [Planctomycetales bacterium]|nr:protein kinase [Planctomycetales bacterium]
MNAGLNQELEGILETFEKQRSQDSSVDVGDFFPEATHAHFGAYATELLRVDLEYRVSEGRRENVDYYIARHPHILSTKTHLNQLAFEEFRLRRASGEQFPKSVYGDRFQIDTSMWPEIHASQAAVGSDSRQIVEYPLPGDEICGFKLISVLGKGTFAQVYLAQQDSLANRMVVVKVSSTRWNESDTMARMQHSNIVPIYSVHRTDNLQCVCMPLLGCTTLADVIHNVFRSSRDEGSMPESAEAFIKTISNRQDETLTKYVCTRQIDTSAATGTSTAASPFLGYNFVDACIWITSQIAEGISHAHACGIIHRDLKPANILLSDDGRPMLLDFNLSDAPTSGGTLTSVGGTLPYMASEHIEAMLGKGTVDGRSDIFATGVILYELLTGQRPFPDRNGELEDICRVMINDRRALDVKWRMSPSLSPSIRSIVGKCLAPDPANRYQSAAELETDLKRQLSHRPLQFAPNTSVRERVSKWSRRHPRLSSSSIIATAAIVILTAVLSAWHLSYKSQQRQIAHAAFIEFTQACNDASIGLLEVNGTIDQDRLDTACQLLSRFESNLAELWLESHIGSSPKREVAEQFVELSYLCSDAMFLLGEQANESTSSERHLANALEINQRAMARVKPTSGLLAQQSRLLLALGRTDEAAAVREDALAYHNDSSFDTFAAGVEAYRQGQLEESIRCFDPVLSHDPNDYRALFARGNSKAAQEEYRSASYDFTQCQALLPDSPYAWFSRGLCFLKLDEFENAIEEFTHVLALSPNMRAALINRAIAYEAQQQHELALEDLNSVLADYPDDTRGLFHRARIFRSLGDTQHAIDDEARAKQSTPVGGQGWLLLGMSILRDDPAKAYECLKLVLKFEPSSYTALRNAAYIASEYLDKTPEAIAYLDRIIELRPQDTEIIASRGVLCARTGRTDDAADDAATALMQKKDARNLVHVACIYSLLSIHGESYDSQAIELLRQAISLDPSWRSKISHDPDFENIKDLADFRALAADHTATSEAE